MQARFDSIRARVRLRTRIGMRIGVAAALVALALALLLSFATAPRNTLYRGPKPTGVGTAVPGNSQVPELRTTQRYASILTTGGVTYLGADTGTVYALRADDGAPLWHVAIGGIQAVILGVQGDTVVALSPDQGNPGSQLVGLRAASGQQVWQRPLDIEVFGDTVDASGVYVNGNTISGANGSAIEAYALGDGAPLWRYDSHGSMPRPILVAGGIVYAQLDHNYDNPYVALGALRESDGRLLWTHPFGDHVEFTGPAVDNGVAYITTEVVAGDRVTGLEIDAFDGTTGGMRWHDTFLGDSPGLDAPVVANGTLYVDGFSAIYALLESDGGGVWRAPRTENGPPPPYLSLLVGDGAVYYPGNLGTIYALRIADGAALWNQHINNSVMVWMEAGAQLDVLTTLGSAYALRAGDGSLLWQQPFTYPKGGGWPGAPSYALGGDVLYATTDGGQVQAMSVADGSVRWHFDLPPKSVVPEPVYTASVTFGSSVAYADALRAVTDLGLHTYGSACRPDWGPQGDANPWNHWLLVSSTPLAPPGWLDPLGKIAGVTQVQTTPVTSCPIIGRATGPLHLPAEQAGTVVRVTFAAEVDYDGALALVDDLGFRLSNPCYERKPAGAATAWRPMGQEQSFAANHSLLVANTAANATIWRQQLLAGSGVTKLDVGATTSCG